MLHHLARFCDLMVILWWLALTAAKITYQVNNALDEVGQEPLRPGFTEFLIFVHRALWIFIPAAVVVDIGFGNWSTTWLGHLVDYIWAVFIVRRWWIDRHWPDENQWWRRGRHLKDKVSALGGKLVVVPETT